LFRGLKYISKKKGVAVEQFRFGRTDMMVSTSGFGALPIQRISFNEAEYLLKKAYEGGINFFDTSRAYTDSEEKIGRALSGVRDNIYIATKSHASDKKTLLQELDTSLKVLKTDRIDVYQLHNPPTLPDYDDPEDLYQVLFDERAKGKIRFIGLSSHRLHLAIQAAKDKRFDTIQFPFNTLSSDEDIKLVSLCRENDIGFIAMKGLSGGLITNAAAAFAFLRQYDNVLPIWGIQRERELLEFLSFEENQPILDDALWAIIDKDRRELSGSFCRGCGYCQPCPAKIPIETAARISLLLTRSPYQRFLTDEFKAKMERINDCIHCNHCKDHCPYGLDTPELLLHMLGEYKKFYNAHKN
jgi:predicted aldo/keto reductase-like oxidoreductase